MSFAQKIIKHKALKSLLVFIAIAAINVILSRFAVITYQVAPTVAALYPAVAFEIAFALWFGLWGILAAYVGTFIGAGLGFVPMDVNFYRSLCDVWEVAIPLIAFRAFKADVALSSARDFIIFLWFGWILNNMAGALWGTSMLVIGGVATWDQVPVMFMGWVVANLIVTITITPILLKFGTRYIKRYGLYINYYWR